MPKLELKLSVEVPEGSDLGYVMARVSHAAGKAHAEWTKEAGYTMSPNVKVTCLNDDGTPAKATIEAYDDSCDYHDPEDNKWDKKDDG